MPKLVLNDARVEINAVDLSQWVEQVQIEYRSEMQDCTTMGNTARKRIGGLLDWTLNVQFKQNFDAAQVDATLFPLVGVSTAIKVRPTSAAIGATNPEYQGNGLIETYSPLGNTVGEVAMAPISMQGDGVLVRAVA